MKQFFSGVCTALPTPFTRDLKIDFPALKTLIDRQIDAGVSALCILGTTGEAPALTFDEKIEIIKFSLAQIQNRLPVIFGIGGNNLENVIALGAEIRQISTAFSRTAPPPKVAVLLSAPYYNKCTQPAAVKWFKTAAAAIALPMLVYNIPTRAGMNLSPETLSQICKIKNIVGVKQSTPDFAQIIDTVRLCKNTAIYAGDDALSLPAYSVGARGLISVASNVRPQEQINIFNTKDPQLFNQEIAIFNALFCEINPAPVKHALGLLGLCQKFVRPPLTPLSQKSIMQHGFHKFFGATHNRK
jgi:4-hydroxy-tetrahydrodipicolinate synthase